MKNFIKNALSEKGEISSIRINLLSGTFYIFLLVIAICYVVIWNKDINYIYAATGTITVLGGLYFGTKVYQKRFEAGQVKDDISVESKEIKSQ
jgi:hypothetical protein